MTGHKLRNRSTKRILAKRETATKTETVTERGCRGNVWNGDGG